MTKKVVRKSMQKKQKKQMHKKPPVKKYKKKMIPVKRRRWYWFKNYRDPELGGTYQETGAPMTTAEYQEAMGYEKPVPPKEETAVIEKAAKKEFKEEAMPTEGEPKKGWWSRRGEGLKKAAGSDFRKKWISKSGVKGSTMGIGKRGVKYTGMGITLGGAGLKSIAGKAGETMKDSIGPIQIFQMAWSRTTGVIKFGVALVFLLALFFVPIGIFYYTGWAVGAAIMFLISLIYWIFINIFNGIAYVIIGALNAVVTIILQLIITIVEIILGFLRGGGAWLTVPNPTWASGYSRTHNGESAWDSTAFNEALKHINEQIQSMAGKTPQDIAAAVNLQGFALYVQPNYWYEGHLLMENTLIRYDQIANIPALMLISRPEWQPGYNETIVSAVLRLFGLNDIADAFKNAIYGIGYTKAFEGFATNGEPWLVVLVGLLPLITITLIVYYIYRKNKAEIGMKWPWNAS